MERKSGGINVKLALIFMSLLPIYCQSAYLSWLQFEGFIRYTEYAIGIISFILLIFLNKGIRFSEISIMMIAFYGYMMVLSIIKNADIITVTKQTVIITYTVVLFDLCRKELDSLFAALQGLLGFLIFFNIISMIVIPEGMSQIIAPEGVAIINFMGHDNSHILYLMPCFVVSEIKIISYRKKRQSTIVRGRILQGLVLINILMIQVGSTTVWILTLLFVYIILNFEVIKKAFSPIVFMMIPAVLNFSLVIMGTQINWIVYLAQVVLNKNATFTGRIYAWRNALNVIRESIGFGHGFYGNETMPKLIEYQQAHNLLLQLLIIGGIVLAIYFVYIIYKIIKKAYVADNKLALFSRAVLFSYLIFTLSESQLNYKMLILLPILWHTLNNNRQARELVGSNINRK